MGVVRVSLAGYGDSSGGVGLLARMPATVRYFMIGLGILVVLSGLAYLDSSAVANWDYFQEVSVAPGRSIFYRVDRWTGEMTRCRTDLAAVGVICLIGGLARRVFRASARGFGSPGVSAWVSVLGGPPFRADLERWCRLRSSR